ncbi:MAG TPA: beta-ketoacyl synthase N-terminal-like domain-containing protein, partial [Polyangiales bacterium]|nr:beta-ketoacyl synthase N-terminal-like domain-containing protein [Polyangiales bacterium]
WVLDAGLAPCPSHVPGEIYVGGVGIARGYWRDPEQTAARFIEHPRTGERLYRSGDWGRWQPDGNLEFLGRRDQQVQVQGYRVELGEIETVLERHPLIERAVVVAIGDREKRLIAHVAPRQLGAEFDAVPQLPVVELATDPTLRQALWAKAGKSESEAIAGQFFSLPAPSEAQGSPRGEAAEGLSLAGMGRMLERLRQVSNDQTPIAKALYASGGSLYPVQVLVSVRPSRVSGLEGGTYYYRPDTHALCHLSGQTIVDRQAADFAFVMLGRLSAIAPLYGEQSEPFCAIEAGAIARLLEQSAVEQGFTLYPMMGVELGELGTALSLEPTDIFLHALCGGQLAGGLVDADILAAARCHASPSRSSTPLLSDPLERLRFKMERRGLRANTGASLVLPRHRSDAEVEQEWVGRRSFRSYQRRASALEDLSGLLSTLRDVDGTALSARSLNPVEAYVSVQPGGVEGLPAGVYRYDVLAHRLLQVSREPAIDPPRAAIINQSTVEQCGFVIVLVGQCDQIGPLYGAQSERQCWLEVGRISQCLEGAASEHAIGLCHIAGTNFAGLESVLQLGPGDICLHALAGGSVDWSGKKRGWPFLTEAAPASALKPTLDSAALRKYCDGLLPGYMVPVQFQLHQTLPLNTNGKVDRGALARASKVIAAPATRGVAAARSAREVDAQAAALMDLVSRAAAESFEVEHVPPHAPFVELGANSLMALRFRERLQQALGRTLPVTIMYDYPTVAAIVDWLQPSAANESALVVPRTDLREPIAVVGMSCRAPGDVIDPDGYWELLCEGRDAIGAFPERWDDLDLYDPNPDARGKTYTRAGGFLAGIEQFDTRFFEISPREAVSMDPQQRLVLEVAWEALERAGIQPRTLKNSVTGVYVGTMGSDYRQQGATSLEDLDGYGTGGASSVLAGRLSYVLGLQGPSLTVDTACSSSLVTLHLACMGLRQGECDLALAGGVQLMITPSYFVEFSRLRGVAEDGRCKSFSASADGVAWAEGCGMIVLKRLSDAQRDGDRVLALVRGSAVNHDGRSQGLTAPNGPSQQRVIRKALAESGLDPRDIDAIEAHGTGTALGDPIEAGALAEVFGPERDPAQPLYLGTAKSNIGHSSAAAGVLGVIKVALSLQHELLPKTLHAEQPSPNVAWEGSGLSLLQEARAWKRGERIRRAGVSAFGVGGTNAHVVIEEAPTQAGAEEAQAKDLPSALPLLLSGRDEAALRAQAQRLADWLRAHPEVRWVDVVHTAALHRTHFDERAVVMAPEALEALAQGQHDPRVVRGRVGGAGAPTEEQGEPSLLRLGELHVQGHAVDWKRVLGEYGGRRVELPTYAFQRERFWIEAGRPRSDARSMGLESVEHPLLGALMPLADSDGYAFSSRLSLREQAWLRDHALQGTVLVPGVAMLELALHAGRALGFEVVRELVLAQPLVLPPDGGVQLQLSVGSEVEKGKRSVSLYSRTDEGAWVQNATGELSLAAGLPASGEFEELRSWPVEHSEPVDLTGVYARTAALGLQYGPAFQGLVELRRAGQVAYGRVVLPDSLRADAGEYDLHPALFDAALHTLFAFMQENDAQEMLLPFGWSDVQLYATGASELRVRAELGWDEATEQLTASVTMSDGAGEPVARVGRLQVRQARLDELLELQSKRSEHLYRVEFRPVPLEVASAVLLEDAVVLGGSGELARRLGAPWYAELDALLARARDGLRPTRVIVDATRMGMPLSKYPWGEVALLPAVHASTATALAQLQALLSEPGLSESELAWVTSSNDLVHAPVWGLVRSARSEHAERSLRLVELESVEQEGALLARGLSASREPELALRGGAWLAARLVRAGAAPENLAEPVRRLDPAGTVLITGGAGELGSALAEHLVSRHGVKHLVLTSRRGADAPGAADLIARLSGLGAESVELLACDVTVRSQVAAVLAQIPSERPLTGVFHLPAVLDDGLLRAQTSERLSAVLAPKVDGAWHLHELTEGQDLACFVLFSSAAGTFGSPGQGNSAAASSFLDALAAHRCKRGLAGTSLAWGIWQHSAAGLPPADQARLARSGITPLSAAQGLSLLDATLSRTEPHLLPVLLSLGTLRRTFAQTGVPALWSALLRPSLRRVSASRRGDASVVRARLAGLPAAERLDAVRELLQAEIAAVLGLPGPSAVPIDQELLMLGLASLSAVELSKRLSVLVGATVPTAELFSSHVLGLGARLVEALESGVAAVPATLQPTLPADPHAPFPLLPIQEAYWVGRQLGAKVGFHSYREMESRSVDLRRLESSWREVIARHDALRIVFTSDGMQRVLAEVPEYVLPVEDLRALDEDACSARLEQVRAQLSGVQRPVDVWPLFEFRALLLPDDKVRLCFDFDLLCLDGTSLGIIVNDWCLLYEQPGRSLPELMARGFEAVVRVGLEARASERYQRDLEYWNQRRPSFDTAPQLPKTRGADALTVHRNIRYPGRLSAEAWRQLSAQARACSITPTMTLCTAFAQVLSRWSAGAPFLLNLTRFSRPDLHPNIYQIAGDFTNLLFLECNHEPGSSFATSAASLQAQLHAHMEHGSVDGVEVLRAWRQAGTEVSAPVVFTSMLGLPVPKSSAGWHGEEVFALTQTPQVWLDFIVSEVDGELQWSWDVIDGLFPAGMIEDMLAAYIARLEALARDPAAWSDAWPELRPERECARIAAVNATSAALTPQTLHGLFAEQALSHPERVALIHDNRSFSYGALHRLATRLGRRLRERGARPNELVAIVMRKGWEQVAGVLSVLYSGAAYVPIDAGLPPERLNKLLRHSGARLALVQQDGGLPAAEVECLVVHDALLEGEEHAELPFVQTRSDLAYVIYTSGSTGEPKGVMIDHVGPVNYVHAINAEFGVCADDRAYGLSALSFDLSVYDMFGMFAAGGALVLPTAEERGDPALWVSPMSHGVTVWNTVPSLLQLLVEHARGRDA